MKTKKFFNFLLPFTIIPASISVVTGCNKSDAEITLDISGVDYLTTETTSKFEYNFSHPESIKTAVWSSNDQSILTIDNQGQATGVKEGMATISLTIKTDSNVEYISEKNVIVIDKSNVGLYTFMSHYNTFYLNYLNSGIEYTVEADGGLDHLEFRDQLISSMVLTKFPTKPLMRYLHISTTRENGYNFKVSGYVPTEIYDILINLFLDCSMEISNTEFYPKEAGYKLNVKYDNTDTKISYIIEAVPTDTTTYLTYHLVYFTIDQTGYITEYTNATNSNFVKHRAEYCVLKLKYTAKTEK